MRIRTRLLGFSTKALLPITLCALLACGARPVYARTDADPDAPRADVSSLYGVEMQQAATQLNWHGERLTEDTTYAVALTGLSWQKAWGKEHLFSLAWGNTRKAPPVGRQNGKGKSAVDREILDDYESRNYRRVVELAFANFTPEEIGCDAGLKIAVGDSLMELNQHERAYRVYACAFDPTRNSPQMQVIEDNRHFREAAFQSARRAGMTKEAIAFALSLLLEPGTREATLDVRTLRYLENAGVDVDRVLLGILEAPENLRGLPAYAYAAADILAYRAAPRYLPILLHLANSDDVHLRARAVVGLGILAYQPRPNDPPGFSDRLVARSLEYHGLSTGERKLIAREIREAADSDKYRLRAAAAIAMGLTGDEENVKTLLKLSKDRAYLTAAPEDDAPRRKAQKLIFPVRLAAAAALARYNVPADPGGGEFSGKSLDAAKRGNQDETTDHRNLRREPVSQINVFPLDIALNHVP